VVQPPRQFVSLVVQGNSSGADLRCISSGICLLRGVSKRFDTSEIFLSEDRVELRFLEESRLFARTGSTWSERVTSRDGEPQSSCCLCAIGLLTFCSLAICFRRELKREAAWGRIHLVPLILAEQDRDAYRRNVAALAREKEIMKDVPNWEVSPRFRQIMLRFEKVFLIAVWNSIYRSARRSTTPLVTPNPTSLFCRLRMISQPIKH